ncbi:hypothetical protein FZC76_02895 [Sutcliffiella horikoshii]|uniref:Uncharacterized protein n=1 Tax=Sutcliffiella horikoshii TaxID=79883 RepID=A0A5D4T588_9BACI|nr:hypothetical protein FZC76_02895 [Sutcliffiella horikoshii]
MEIKGVWTTFKLHRSTFTTCILRFGQKCKDFGQLSENFGQLLKNFGQLSKIFGQLIKSQFIP